MPQLLHFLQVDEQTKLAAPVPAPASAAGEGEGGAAAEDGPPTATPEGGRAFFNKSNKVRQQRNLFQISACW
jgi:hypothetical protein